MLGAYLLREFLQPLLCALLAFVMLFLLIDMFDDIPDFNGKHVPLPITILYFLAKQPLNLVNVIPISTLLAASFMTVSLGRNSEITAMKAAGLSIASCYRPVWISSILLCISVLCIQELVGPSAMRMADDIRLNWLDANKKRDTRIAFHNPSDGRDWLVESLDEASGVGQGIVIRQYRDDGSTEYLLKSPKGTYGPDGWTFEDAVITPFSVSGHPVGETQRHAVHPCPFPETPKDLQGYSGELENLTISELLQARHAKMKPSPKERQVMDVMLWYHGCFPLACLVGALFGVSLSITHERTGAMKGFASAVGLLVLFYLCCQFGLVMGKNGWLPPFVSGALPSLAFTTAGLATLHCRR